jgi:predicted O-methyltransferase YrrM
VRRPTARSLTVSAAAGSTATVACVLVLGALDVLALADAFQLAVGVAALGVLTAILVGQRRVDGKVQRLIRSHRKHAEQVTNPEIGNRIDELDSQVTEVLAALGEERVMALTHDEAASSRLSQVEQRVGSLASALTEGTVAVRATLDKLTGEAGAIPPRLDELTGKVKELKRSGEADYKQLEAYVDLRGLIRPRAPMPALRGWAASPDVLRFLAESMWSRRPKLIVECGSGSSSVWLGYFAEQLGAAKVVALENDERFAAISRDLVRAHGLEDIVDIRLAPLTDWRDEDETYAWYSTDALDDLGEIGLVFVDGPVGITGRQVRYPALPLLLSRCTADVVVVLDDSDRGEETAISDRWLAEYPELERVVQRFDKGAHVFRRRAQ